MDWIFYDNNLYHEMVKPIDRLVYDQNIGLRLVNAFMHNIEKMAKLWCSARQICKVCLAVFNHYTWKV